MHDGMVEHRLDRRRQCLGAVEHAQDRPGGVEAPVAQVDQQVVDHRGVLGVTLHHAERVLGPVDADARGHHAQWSAKCTPSIISATRSSPDRSAASISASAVSVAATNRRLTELSTWSWPWPRPPRPPARGRPGSGGWRAWPSSAAGPWRRAARCSMNTSYASTGSSPVPSALRTRGRRTGTRRPPRVTDPSSLPWRTAVRSGSCRPFGPPSAVTLSCIITFMTCEAGADRQGQQALAAPLRRSRPSRWSRPRASRARRR